MRNPDFAHEEAMIRKKRDLGSLHKLLLEACPPVDGVKSIEVLAKQLKVSPQALRKAIRRNSFSPRRAVKVVELSEGRVTLADFSPFIYF